ncbi:S1 family peptidase [Paenibacillus tengchongensis]|uniref:S1 family peptidase n=1 Tax=Paenibacillus tengchongensis TaxID=2608684 RepID=UPI00124EB435|nr:serine protease [Paenibacillus tengchongensis]
MAQFKYIPNPNVMKTAYQQYRYCLVKIIVQSEAGESNIGTGFHIGNGYIVTARHVIDNNAFEIYGEYKNRKIEYSDILFHDDPIVDVVILKTDFNLDDYINGLKLEKLPSYHDKIPLNMMLSDQEVNDRLILNKVLLMGYPPIPLASDAFLVAAEGEINAIIDPYLLKGKHFIISSLPRGGFSGGPVIIEYGYVLGVLVSALSVEGKDYELGYAAAVSTDPIK